MPVSLIDKAYAQRETSHQAALRWLIMSHFELHRPVLLVEVGVYRGDTPSVLLHDFPQLLYIGVDPWLPFGEEPPYESLVNARFLAQEAISRYPIRARLLEMSSALARQMIADGTADVAFIDAAHGYEHARDDLRGWWPKVRPGGVLAAHDYEFQSGVRQAVDEWKQTLQAQQTGYVGGSADLWWCVKPKT